MERIQLSELRPGLLHYAANSVAFYGFDLARFSTLLLLQIYSLEKQRVISSFHITDAMGVLENIRSPNRTGRPTQFQHLPLKGLHKVHFFSPRFLQKNLLNFQLSKPGQKLFNAAWKEALSHNESGLVDEEFIGRLVHGTVIGGYEAKSKIGMTGEWIVFQKTDSGNLYLTLAEHTEDDQAIYDRAKAACVDVGFDFQGQQ